MIINPEPLVLNTGHLSPPDPAKSLWENRAAAYQMYDEPGVPKCTIAVTAYNRLEKTKYCVECILKYTREFDYELLLIDNGSDDGTLEFFQSVPHGRKKVVRVTKNIGFCYAWLVAKNCFSGKYLVIVSSDVYVTKNWLSNLLRCYESDPRVGFVEPVSINVSNNQTVELGFSDFDEMQAKAAVYNQSDPLKWEERLRCISLIGVYSRPVLDTVGLGDTAYLHDFTEDDLAERLRRAGYKLLLCRDTWVCHDHPISGYTATELAALRVSATYGRTVFQQKFPGLDAWDDSMNFEFALLSPLDTHGFGPDTLKILVVDPRCGTPVLEIRNRLRRRGLLKTETHAFTTKPQHYTDLLVLADTVRCDRVQFLEEYYSKESFDIIVLCEPVDAYPDVNDVMMSVDRLLKRGGMRLHKLRDNEGGGEQAFLFIKEDA